MGKRVDTSAVVLMNYALHSSGIRHSTTLIATMVALIFSALWVLKIAEAWVSCYATAVAFSIIFLWTHRRNLISLNGIFVGLSLIAITLPSVPYLIFEFEPAPSFYASIYLHSLGQIYFVTLALLLAPNRPLYCADSNLFRGPRWAEFVRINRLICLLTLPFVFLAITAAGAWGYLLGDRTGSFDRISSLKGLGPLMIFSIINVMALFFWVSSIWLKGNKARALVIVALLLFINGFAGGRQNYISLFFSVLIISVAFNRYSKKNLFLIPVVGLAIIFQKIFRTTGDDLALDLPSYVTFFLHFAGDFDSLNNTSALIDYTRQNGFFGLYHIWSNVLVYLPRELFPWKPHDIGGLYLNTFLFPGVYLGAEGGTGLSIGFQGIWYAAYGLSTLILGNLLLVISLSWADRRIYKKLHRDAPSIFLVAYIFLLGQSIIIYRDGFYAFLNTFFYVGVYYIFYILIQSIVKKHAITSAPRHLETA